MRSRYALRVITVKRVRESWHSLGLLHTMPEASSETARPQASRRTPRKGARRDEVDARRRRLQAAGLDDLLQLRQDRRLPMRGDRALHGCEAGRVDCTNCISQAAQSQSGTVRSDQLRKAASSAEAATRAAAAPTRRAPSQTCGTRAPLGGAAAVRQPPPATPAPPTFAQVGA